MSKKHRLELTLVLYLNDEHYEELYDHIREALATGTMKIQAVRDEDTEQEGPDDVEEQPRPGGLSSERESILDYLTGQDQPMSVKDIALAIDMPYNNVVQLLRRMKQSGQVHSPRRGLYEAIV